MSKEPGQHDLPVRRTEATVSLRRFGNMYTDPKAHPGDIPGTVEGNPVFIYHERVSTPIRPRWTTSRPGTGRGRSATSRSRRRLAVALNRFLDPMRERRARFETDSASSTA